ncbi:MAG: hypothetical protein INR68_15820 [Methylobacterium mesophilicum]|nr:hypothetical protein [Methylobacterium mesophilicum]
MSGNEHPKTTRPSDKDLRDNPGIGASKGTAKIGDDDVLDGENTFTGDVESDASRANRIDPHKTGRTNK